MPEEDFHPSNQVHFQAHQGPTLVVPLEFLHFQHHICSRRQLDPCQYVQSIV